MRRFRRRRDVSFHRPESDSFRLDTGDVAEGRPFWARLFGRRGRRDVFSRYIAAGGTRDVRNEGQDALERRSWRRFSLALGALVLIWMLGAWL